MNDRPRFLIFSKEEQMLLTKRLALLLRSGVPILSALSLMQEEARTRSSIHILATLRETVASGRPLSQGLAPFRRNFGDLGMHLIEVGETSGTLAEHLERFSQSIKKERMLKRKVIGALIYPAIIVCATLGITMLLILYVFPKIIPVFKGFHAKLPLSTRFLIGADAFFSQYGVFVIGFVLAFIAGLYYLFRFELACRIRDRYVLRIPLFGTLLREYIIAGFCRALGTLIRSGVGVVRAVEMCASGMGNLAYREACVAVAARISSGQKASKSFSAEPRLFPSLMLQMLTVGESTGSLSDNLLFCADFYEEEIDELSKNIAVLVEPMLMIVMGLIVGFIALAIITPIYGITQNLTSYH